MQTFLKQVADYVNDHYGDNLSDLCIVLPNRRAGLFLKKYLAENISKPVWAPDIFSVEDFVFELTGLQRIDPVYLQFDLYNVYIKQQNLEPKTFNEFINFGQVILQDFNDIDLYLVDPDSIFNYLSEIKAIKLWNPDGSPLTEFEKQYLQFFKSLGPLYKELSKVLQGKNQVYEGLAYKVLSEKLKKDNVCIKWKHVLFAGLNALTKAEESIISSLKEMGIAELVWDADSYYSKNPVQEAGFFLRKNANWLKTPELDWTGNNFAKGEKNIQVIGVPKNIGQVKIAGNLIKELFEQKQNLNSSAVVLNNETLSIPMLNSLPMEVGEFNFTMGLPLKETALYKLVNRLMVMHENALKFEKNLKSEPGYHYADVIKVLDQSYISDLISYFEGDKSKIEISNLIIKQNKAFITAQQIIEIGGFQNLLTLDFLAMLFDPWNNSPSNAIICFTSLIEELKKYFTVRGGENQGSKIEMEYVFYFAKVINKLKEVFKSFEFLNDLQSFRIILLQIVQSVSIPFYGEPLQGIQVMGMLETRVLDFENVIMLSVNEDFLPSSKTSQSFIPYEIRRENDFGLPTYHERNAVFAYHFYRLLQRAKSIFLIYNTEANDLGGGDKSRFITQLQNELHKYNGNIKITEKLLTVPPGKIDQHSIEINKNEQIIERLNELAKRGFSASSLNIFRTCSLRFYFQYVIGIEENEEVEETIEASTLGTVVHDVLQKLFTPFENKIVKTEDVQKMKKQYKDLVHQSFSENFISGDIKHGKNLLIARVAETYIQKFLRKEIEYLNERSLFNEYLTILSLENKYYKNFIFGSGSQQKTIRLKGVIDRVDRVGGYVRIIDYKTGSVSQRDLVFKDWDDLLENPKLDKCFQLLLYAYIFPIPEDEKDELQSGIISLRNMSSGFIPLKYPGMNKHFNQEFEQLLNKIFKDIYDADNTFKQTESSDNCKYCPYVSICNR